MLLRRIIEHVKEQNWIAILLDFFIVVLGVGVALWGEQWLADRQKEVRLTEAENGLTDDLINIYRNAKERLAIAECRKQRTLELSELLLQSGTQWPGSPLDRQIGAIQHIIPEVVHSPSRIWPSQFWEVEFSRGTFNDLDIERLQLYAHVFDVANRATNLQVSIYGNQTRLKALGQQFEMTASDRLRYFDILAQLDDQSAYLELIASQVIASIDEIGINLDEGQRKEFRVHLADLNTRGIDAYGECRELMVFPFLEEES